MGAAAIFVSIAARDRGVTCAILRADRRPMRSHRERDLTPTTLLQVPDNPAEPASGVVSRRFADLVGTRFWNAGVHASDRTPIEGFDVQR